MAESVLQRRKCIGCGEPYVLGEDVHLCYEPDDAPTIARFMECDDVVRMIIGPVGSGKSSGCCMEPMRRTLMMPPCADGWRRSRGVIIRNTYGELADTTRRTFEQWFPSTPRGSEGGAYSCVWDENDFSCVIRVDDGADIKVEMEVLFRALDRPEHIKKLLSLELTWAYINECREVPKAVFDMVQTRLDRFPRRADMVTPENPLGEFWSGLWCDTNPCDTDHWIYKLFEEEKPTLDVEIELEDGSKRMLHVRYALFKQPSGLSKEAENRRHLPPGYYEKKMVGKDKDWIDVNIRGQYGFVKEGKPVWPEYGDDRHCKPVAPLPHLPIEIGMDFGLTPAAVLGQRVPGTGQLQIFDELVATRMGAVNFAKELKALINRSYPGREVIGWGDPAGEADSQVDERTPFEVVQEQGLPIDPAPTNDATRRLEAVRGRLTTSTIGGAPAFIVDPRCKILRKALGGAYCLERKQVSGEERFKDKPSKNEFSHVADALQYLCVGGGDDNRAIQGSRRPGKVKVGIKVKRSVKCW